MKPRLYYSRSLGWLYTVTYDQHVNTYLCRLCLALDRLNRV